MHHRGFGVFYHHCILSCNSIIFYIAAQPCQSYSWLNLYLEFYHFMHIGCLALTQYIKTMCNMRRCIQENYMWNLQGSHDFELHHFHNHSVHILHALCSHQQSSRFSSVARHILVPIQHCFFQHSLDVHDDGWSSISSISYSHQEDQALCISKDDIFRIYSGFI